MGGGGRGEPRETDPHLFLDQLRERGPLGFSQEVETQRITGAFRHCQGLKGPQALTKLNFRGKKASGIDAVFVINRRFSEIKS